MMLHAPMHPGASAMPKPGEQDPSEQGLFFLSFIFVLWLIAAIG